nr:YbaB/EbfC family nucleoid-associated protein [Gordonia sp. SID5947]
MGNLNSMVSRISEAQHRALALTATATGLDGQITVSVNARGIVTEVLVDDALTQVTGKHLGEAITAAAQKAAAEVDEQLAEVWDPINQQQAAFPRSKDAFAGLASDFLAGLPDIDDLLGSRPQPPLTPPGRRRTEPDDQEVYFEDAEERPERPSNGFQDRAW